MGCLSNTLLRSAFSIRHGLMSRRFCCTPLAGRSPVRGIQVARFVQNRHLLELNLELRWIATGTGGIRCLRKLSIQGLDTTNRPLPRIQETIRENVFHRNIPLIPPRGTKDRPMKCENLRLGSCSRGETQCPARLHGMRLRDTNRNVVKLRGAHRIDCNVDPLLGRVRQTVCVVAEFQLIDRLPREREIKSRGDLPDTGTRSFAVAVTISRASL